jgi:hypothetical protein
MQDRHGILVTDKNEEFSPSEAKRRFEAALRGARIAGHKPKDSMTPKRPKAQRSKAKKARV